MGWFGSASPTQVAPSTRAGPVIDEADRLRYKEIFDRHASVSQSVNGTDERFMNVEDFVAAATPNKEFYQVRQPYQVVGKAKMLMNEILIRSRKSATPSSSV